MARRLILSLFALWAALALACGGPRDGIGPDGYKRLTDQCRQYYTEAGRLVTECRK